MNRHVRNVCRRIPEIDVHQKFHYTGNIVEERLRRHTLIELKNKVHNVIVPMYLCIGDEICEQLYEDEL